MLVKEKLMSSRYYNKYRCGCLKYCFCGRSRSNDDVDIINSFCLEFFMS